MDNEFNDIEDAMVDLMIDQLHKCAELEMEEADLDTAWVSSSADRATAF
tara:strand:- start:355 stop:501 length:147 start_codon:yes stop_codon:yes gene_type:complete